MRYIPYLVFSGDAEEALSFYQKIFQGKISALQRFKDLNMPDIPDIFQNALIHAELHMGDLEIHFSDSPNEVIVGDNVTILIDCSSEEELERIYNALAIEAQEIHMPPQKMFWNAKYANLTDRFGVPWQLNYQY